MDETYGYHHVVLTGIEVVKLLLHAPCRPWYLSTNAIMAHNDIIYVPLMAECYKIVPWHMNTPAWE